MKARIFVRDFTEEERQALIAGLRSSDVFVFRRSQILLLLVKQGIHLGWMGRPVSIETMRQTLSRLGINWKRAKHWITSPDPLYQGKKLLATDC